MDNTPKTIDNVTWFTDIEIFICNDCGAFSKKEEDISHHQGCVAGDSKKWELYYNVVDEKRENNEKRPA